MRRYSLLFLLFVPFVFVPPALAFSPEMEQHLRTGLSGELPAGGVSYDATLQGEPGAYTLKVLGMPCSVAFSTPQEDQDILDLELQAQQPGIACATFNRVQVVAQPGGKYAVQTFFRGADGMTSGAAEFSVSPVRPARTADTLPQRPDPGKPVTRATAELLQHFLPEGSQHVPLGKTDLGICSDGTRYMDGSPNGGHCVSVAENSDLARAGLETHDRIFYVLLDVGSQVLIGDDTQSVFLMLGRGHVGRAYEIHYEKSNSTDLRIARFQATDWYFNRHGDQFGNRPLAGIPEISENCRAERAIIRRVGLEQYTHYMPADACQKIIYVPMGWSYELPNFGLRAEYRGYSVQRFQP